MDDNIAKWLYHRSRTSYRKMTYLLRKHHNLLTQHLFFLLSFLRSLVYSLRVWVFLRKELYLAIIWMVNSGERTSFRPLSLTNTLKD